MKNKKTKIYLDYGATTPIDKKVLKTMMKFFDKKYGNPMSIHSFGNEASQVVEKVREQIAHFLNSNPKEIIFTSGSTESNNLAIKGIIKAYYDQFGNNALKPHIITTQFEHHCVFNACKAIEKEGLADVTYLKVSKDGFIDLEELKNKIKKPNTILVSVIYVNNEIGTVQPIEKIGSLIKEIKKASSKYPLFHTDATQAVNYFSQDVFKLGVDLLSISGHKIYGPKGVGVLYIKNGTPIKQLFDGGEQENGFRSGTHNVSGIAGLGKAIEIISKNKDIEFNKIKKLRDYLIEKVLKEIPQSQLNGSRFNRSPNNCNFRFKNVEGESLVLMLDAEGINCSTGSACSSSSLKPSHVLLALGIKPEEAHSSLRITLGRFTTKKEIDSTIDKLKQTVNKLRKISGNVLLDYNKNNNN